MARETYIKNLFELGLTTAIAIGLHTRRTNKAGMVFENASITAVKIGGGRVVQLQDSCFDVGTPEKTWGE